MYDLIIIGSGPAGLSAGIYAARAKLSFLVIEKSYISGGQIVNTYEIDNYPGFSGLSGMKLAEEMRSHAERLGVQFKNALVERIEIVDGKKIVHTESETLETKTVIIATGADHSKLGIAGEEEFSGRGVSYCATCDGAFYRNKEVAVVGGGNVAVEDAIFLARACKKVYIVHRRNEFRAEKILQEQLLSLPNVETVLDCNAIQIEGENKKVSALVVKNKNTGEERKISVNGVFIAVGIVPVSEIFKNLLKTDEKGYIVAGENCRTSLEGVFVAGDVRTKELRQVVTAVSDGANAVSSAQRYLLTNEW